MCVCGGGGSLCAANSVHRSDLFKSFKSSFSDIKNNIYSSLPLFPSECEAASEQKRKIWVTPWKSPENKSCIQTRVACQKPKGSSRIWAGTL